MRTQRSPRGIGRLVVACFTLGAGHAAGGCSDPDEQLRTDARRLLAIQKSIAYEAPAKERERSVARLSAVLLVTPAVRATRDLCVAGHRELLEAERAQEGYAAEIDTALAAQDGGGPLPEATLAALKAKLVSAEKSLQSAREQLQACEAQTRSLDLRFGVR